MSEDTLNSTHAAPTVRRLRAAGCGLGLVATLLLAGPAAASGDAAPTVVADGAVAGLTEYQARKRIYGYLGGLGYSRSIGPGGASIQDFEAVAGGWLATVRLRGASAVQTRQTRLFVDARRGQVSQAERHRRVEYAGTP